MVTPKVRVKTKLLGCSTFLPGFSYLLDVYFCPLTGSGLWNKHSDRENDFYHDRIFSLIRSLWISHDTISNGFRRLEPGLTFFPPQFGRTLLIRFVGRITVYNHHPPSSKEAGSQLFPHGFLPHYKILLCIKRPPLFYLGGPFVRPSLCKYYS